jgi:hypothetical protein
MKLKEVLLMMELMKMQVNCLGAVSSLIPFNREINRNNAPQ